MTYITKTYYDDEFHGKSIPANEFNRLEDIASEVIYEICRVKPDEDDVLDAAFKKAVAYEVEFLQEQGGVDAILGFSDMQLSAGSEHLGDYSVSGGGNSASSSGSSIIVVDGIPVSSLSIMLLRRMGLMSRWAFAGVKRAKQKNPS